MALHTPGTILEGRYRIDGVIGQGGMGAVYCAEDVFKGDKIAIKELMDDEMADPAEKEEARLLFDNEARILSQLSHPSLVGVRDRFSDMGNYYLVMDFVEGDTLESLLKRRGRFDESQVVEWAAELAGALRYLHNHVPPVIFRDLKPSNIIATNSGRLKLVDFGIARTFKRGKLEDTINIGSPGYAAPEQYGGRGQTDPRTDIFALGVVMHQLLTGIAPSQYQFNLPAVSQFHPDATDAVIAIIEKATRLSPEDRYQEISDLERDLHAAGAGSFAPPSSYSAVGAGSLAPPSPYSASASHGGAITPPAFTGPGPFAPPLFAVPSSGVPFRTRLIFGAVGFFGSFIAVILPFIAGAANENAYQAAQIMRMGSVCAFSTGIIVGLLGFSGAK
jgi:serine/threonine-protein kinase